MAGAAGGKVSGWAATLRGVISAQPSAAARQRGRDAGGQPGLRLRWALPGALAGGLLLAVSFPPVGIWPLAPVGVALLTVALAGRNLRASFLCGLVFGVAFLCPRVLVINVWRFAWTALRGVGRHPGRLPSRAALLRLPGWPVAVAGWWVSLEALRDRFPFGGFPWGRLAMSQASAPTAGWAAVAGHRSSASSIALVGRQPGLADPVRAGPPPGEPHRRQPRERPKGRHRRPPAAAGPGSPGAGRGGHGRAGGGRGAAAGGSHLGREDGEVGAAVQGTSRGPATCRRSSTTPR